MNRFSSNCGALVAVAISVAVVHQAVADPPDILRNYRFIPADTTVHVTGGSPAYDLNLTIAGRFGLVTGYHEEVSPTAKVPTLDPFAQFINVHGILYNPLSAAPLPVPGWDLDKTLNLSSLSGTFSTSNPNQLFFFGADSQGVAERFEADLNGAWLHLMGGSTDPPSSKSVLYQVDALAHLVPFPDFNGDGTITAADISAMMQALSNPTAYEAQHDLSSDDFLSMGDIDGDGKVTNADIQALISIAATNASAASGGSASVVPEPASMLLFGIGGLLVILNLCRRRVD